MKIKMIKESEGKWKDGKHTRYIEGRTYDIDNAQGEAFIKQGIAERITNLNEGDAAMGTEKQPAEIPVVPNQQDKGGKKTK